VCELANVILQDVRVRSIDLDGLVLFFVANDVLSGCRLVERVEFLRQFGALAKKMIDLALLAIGELATRITALAQTHELFVDILQFTLKSLALGRRGFAKLLLQRFFDGLYATAQGVHDFCRNRSRRIHDGLA